MLLLTNMTLDSTITPFDVPLFQIYTLIIGISAVVLLFWTKGELAYSKLKNFESESIS